MSQETTGRSRRARKKVDYSIEQQFSDDDVFEDGPKEEPATKKKSRARKSTGGGVAQSSGGYYDSGMSFERTKPVYTERGYDNSQLPLRERFTFEPEYEDDGTPSIEMIVGRRPIDDTKDRTAASSGAAGDEEENESMDGDDEEARTRSTRSKKSKKKKRSSIKNEGDEDDEDGEGKSEMDYEYLIKYKGRSYLHLEWKTAADLESMNTKAKTIYRRFLKKLELGTDEDLEDPTVDPTFTEPGRILAEEEHEIMVELSDKELVKWEKEQKKAEMEMEGEGDVGGVNEEEEKKEETEDVKMEVDEAKVNGVKKEEEEEPIGKFVLASD